MFDDSLALTSALAIWGQPAEIIPMATPASPNAEAEPDAARGVMAVTAIRSEYAARMDLANNGMGRAAGGFRLSQAGQVHLCTVEAAACPWPPRTGDHVRYADRPEVTYRIAENRADGGAGLHFVLNRF